MVRGGPDEGVIREPKDEEPVTILGPELFLGIGMALDLSDKPLDFKHVVDEESESFLEDDMAFVEEGDSVFLDILHGTKAKAVYRAARDKKSRAQEMALDLALFHSRACKSSLDCLPRNAKQTDRLRERNRVESGQTTQRRRLVAPDRFHLD
jgi:hypothetical protein